MLRWPLREALVSLREVAKRRAVAAHRHELVVWAIFRAMGGKGKAPEPPAILRDA